MDEQTCNLLRDVGDNYKPLERLFGRLSDGMAFGLSSFMHLNETQKRFYNAIALRDTVCLTLQKSDLLEIMDHTQKRT